ncbi:hypothetical protein Q8F55_006377 [Vanrija albida]|uniref:Uncharacterized protein n=1 Tax=Vanrija albida TaxID=181172 RepID=A0ABR3PWX4_9TREE
MATATSSPFWRKLLCIDATPRPETKQLYSRAQVSRRNLGHVDEASSTTPLRRPASRLPAQRTVSFSTPLRIDTAHDDSAALLMGFSTEEPEGGWAAARGWTPASPKASVSGRGKTEAQLLAEEARAAAAEARAEREKAAAAAEGAEVEAAKSDADGARASVASVASVVSEKEAGAEGAEEAQPSEREEHTEPAEPAEPTAPAEPDTSAAADAPSPASPPGSPPPDFDLSVNAPPTHDADAPSSADNSIRIDFTASPAPLHAEVLGGAGEPEAEVLAGAEGAVVR